MSVVPDFATDGFLRGMQQLHAALAMEGMALGESASGVRSLAVAYSGGLDSTVLLHLAHSYAQTHGLRLVAFHIHHGISPHADQWLEHCRNAAQALGVGFFSEHITLAQKNNLEAQARKARYAALGRLCREHGAPLLLTAHHLDDQAETVLLKLLRGAQVAKGMTSLMRAADLLGSEEVWIARPLLAVSRRQITDFAAANTLSHVTDDSNFDVNYARNALRTQVMPTLAQHFPGFQQVLARASSHAQDTDLLLDDLAQQDLARYAVGGGALLAGDGLSRANPVAGLQLLAMTELGSARALNLLRYWLASHGARLPSSSWLRELHSQLCSARDDAQICVVHPDCEIHRYRGVIQLAPRWQSESEAQRFVWQGESELAFPAFGGCLQFDLLENEGVAEGDEPGIDLHWLRQQTLVLQYRQGGERIKLGLNRPHRSLKQHYQSMQIPAWQRTRLPLVYVLGDEPGLLYAAGIGCASGYCGQAAQRVRLNWHSVLQQ
jgi:tRNA(Ile)-lysidine synthase